MWILHLAPSPGPHPCKKGSLLFFLQIATILTSFEWRGFFAKSKFFNFCIFLEWGRQTKLNFSVVPSVTPAFTQRSFCKETKSCKIEENWLKMTIFRAQLIRWNNVLWKLICHITMKLILVFTQREQWGEPIWKSAVGFQKGRDDPSMEHIRQNVSWNSL